MFNAKEVTNEIIKFIQDYFKENNLKGVVLGISGGKDSAVVAGLFCKALGNTNVIGVTLPCNSNEKDKMDAQIISNHFGFRLFNLDLSETFKIFNNEFNRNFNSLDFNAEILNDSNINLKPRLRMASVYYIAQAFSSLENSRYIVAGTSNLSEIYVGYFTKGGDNVCDISVLGNLTVEEVIKIGDYIGVPKEILYKTPSDGLSNLTDEEKLGVTYQDISKVINGKKVKLSTLEKINALHLKNKHKFIIPTYKKGE
jgi:NAD+ synthase